MSNKINIHSGHRKRFREMIENTDVYNISELHYLEHLLMFVIPRADTNPIAHRLLEEFKTIDNVFEATKDSLLQIEGIGEKSADFLTSLSGACYLYNRAKTVKNPFVGNFKSAINYINGILPHSKNEQFVVLILGKNLEVKHYKIFSGISHCYINFDSKELTEYLIKHKASFCIMAHTHPENSSYASDSDIKTFYKLTPLLDALSITLIDNLIIGEKDFYSFKLESVFKYSEIENDFTYIHKFSTAGVNLKPSNN